MAIIPDQKYALKGSQIEDLASRIGDNTEDIETLEEQIQALATDISLKGSVDDFEHLPADAAIGDAYITEDTGILYVWVGDKWVALNEDGGGATLFYISDQSSWAESSQIPLYAEKTLTNPIAKPQFMDAAKQGPIVLVVVATQDAPTDYYNWDYYSVVFNEDDSMSETLGSLHFAVMGYIGLIQFTWDQTTNPVVTGSFSFPNIVQTTGTSTTSVMSQKATTNMLWRDPTTKKTIQYCSYYYPDSWHGNDNDNIYLGSRLALSASSDNTIIGHVIAATSANKSVAIGNNLGIKDNSVAIGYKTWVFGNTRGSSSVSIGSDISSVPDLSIIIGSNASMFGYAAPSTTGSATVTMGCAAQTNARSAIAIGHASVASQQGEFNIGVGALSNNGTAQTSYGHNGSSFRLLSGVDTPQNAHDAATKAYVDANAPTNFTTNEWNALWA